MARYRFIGLYYEHVRRQVERQMLLLRCRKCTCIQCSGEVTIQSEIHVIVVKQVNASTMSKQIGECVSIC